MSITDVKLSTLIFVGKPPFSQFSLYGKVIHNGLKFLSFLSFFSFWFVFSKIKDI